MLLLDVLSLVPVAVFVLTIYLVYKHPSVKIPFTSKYVHIDYGYAPIIGVILLFPTFSNLKRTFGEFVLAREFKNMVQEMMLKAFSYNLLMNLSLGR